MGENHPKNCYCRLAWFTNTSLNVAIRFICIVPAHIGDEDSIITSEISQIYFSAEINRKEETQREFGRKTTKVQEGGEGQPHPYLMATRYKNKMVELRANHD
nr:hypothetical protein [Tanacetum cinerariifolium]GEZ68070.1 hypothetical protein [Tanacetum cinerariifolium]